MPPPPHSLSNPLGYWLRGGMFTKQLPVGWTGVGTISHLPPQCLPSPTLPSPTSHHIASIFSLNYFFSHPRLPDPGPTPLSPSSCFNLTWIKKYQKWKCFPDNGNCNTDPIVCYCSEDLLLMNTPPANKTSRVPRHPAARVLEDHVEENGDEKTTSPRQVDKIMFSSPNKVRVLWRDITGVYFKSKVNQGSVSGF